MPHNDRYFSLRMPEAMHYELEQIAAEQERSIAAVVRLAARDYIAYVAAGYEKDRTAAPTRETE